MRALLSVYDKSGVVEFARQLVDLGWELISTGGTMSAISAAGLPVTAVSEVTQSPEMLDGRVKTLHPRIHGGLLARRDLPDHLAQLEAHGIDAIDLLASNLYPFEATIAQPGITDEEAIEQIDIGGPAMVRAAAKNHAGVIVVTDPSDYDAIIAALKSGSVDQPLRRSLAAKAYAHTSAYDSLVAAFLRNEQTEAPGFPEEWSVAGRKISELRYGENPQQRGAAYRRLSINPESSILDAKQLAGKELSFNNLLDTDAAWSCIQRLNGPAVSIIKHTIPCGLAQKLTLPEAFQAALDGDPVSAFGGIVALSQPVDAATAELMSKVFFEVVIAPGFAPEAVEILGKKKNLRLLEMPAGRHGLDGKAPIDFRVIRGGLLLQDADDRADDPATWQVVTTRKPTEREWDDLVFAWEAVRHVKSNAIVIAKDGAILGTGPGQPNRVESTLIAIKRAGDRVAGSVLAGDAFFPFPDSIEAAIAAGVTAIAHPGGSMRDDQVIAAAEAAGITLVVTGTRHFKH
ncbi:MAG: bifunctional phosphoribosylaminoimidazolecarboxamide formyltransferase/IMP cyclohydrolase [Thermomicrobiales bacterium]|nr:bifunctional phosphoribosylaminoimidazolecarboxamide formyltransferase/IMP cyclohydrolase [Thermomicrobiales bacterium]